VSRVTAPTSPAGAGNPAQIRAPQVVRRGQKIGRRPKNRDLFRSRSGEEVFENNALAFGLAAFTLKYESFPSIRSIPSK
jgi:hypothetical protein